MEALINQLFWEEVLDFDEMVNDFEFNQNLTNSGNISTSQFNCD